MMAHSDNAEARFRMVDMAKVEAMAKVAVIVVEEMAKAMTEVKASTKQAAEDAGRWGKGIARLTIRAAAATGRADALMVVAVRATKDAAAAAEYAYSEAEMVPEP